MGKIIDNYILEHKIGQGQYGKVYYGYCKDNNLEIAAKQIKKKRMTPEILNLLKAEI